MALGRQAAAKPGEAAVGADHAVAGHHDRQRIAAVGGADGAHRLRFADASRKFTVADRRAIRNAAQFFPLDLRDGLLIFPRWIQNQARKTKYGDSGYVVESCTWCPTRDCTRRVNGLQYGLEGVRHEAAGGVGIE